MLLKQINLPSIRAGLFESAFAWHDLLESGFQKTREVRTPDEDLFDFDPCTEERPFGS